LILADAQVLRGLNHEPDSDQAYHYRRVNSNLPFLNPFPEQNNRQDAQEQQDKENERVLVQDGHGDILTDIFDKITPYLIGIRNATKKGFS
jgi:hypothetical protein